MNSAVVPVTAVVLTYNEERNLDKCLRSIAGRVQEIVVVDSFSSDGTLDIARRYGAQIHQHAYEGHPQQWQWTLDNVATSGEWIFAIDADFVVTDALWGELANRFLSPGPRENGFYVRHREVFRGRRISFGGVYPSYWLRLFRRNMVRIDPNELVDIHFYVTQPVGRIEFDVEEQNYKDDDIFFWVQKQNNFARRQAREEMQRWEAATGPFVAARFTGTPDERKLFMKAIWYRLPLYLRPLLYFFYRYFLRVGFLDGKEGFIYHFTQGYLYRLLVDINIDQMREAAKGG